jgi:Transposase IS200 like.
MLLPSARIAQLKGICSEIGKRYCFEFDAIGTDGDHVHIFVGSEPKYSPSKVMQIIVILITFYTRNLFTQDFEYPSFIE